MKVLASVKCICRNCKIIKRKRVVRVICSSDGGRSCREFAERDVSCEAGKRTCSSWPYFWKDADALHPNFAGRQGNGGDDSLRPDKSQNYFPREVKIK